MSKIIGIDLGTTNSAVAVVEGGKPKIIHSEEGENIIPSVVDPVKRVAGRVAKRQAVVSPKNTIFSVKRLMGRKFNDKTVQGDIKWLPYEIKEGKISFLDKFRYNQKDLKSINKKIEQLQKLLIKLKYNEK